MGRAVVAIFYVLSFCSGVAALIYEVAWAKMLALTFGSTTMSVAAVVAGFMGGMGLGAWLYHILGDRTRRPALVYGCLEIGIALSTAALSATFYNLPTIFAEISAAIGPGPWFEVLRFASIFVLLLIPAALMGATYPALCSVVIHSARGLDRHLGMIYGINTLGAAVGVLFAGFFLLERFGLHASTYAANAINIAVGCAAIAMFGAGAVRRRAFTAARVEGTRIETHLPRAVTGLVLFGSGLATLSYEIVWFRSLHYFSGNATYAMTTVLIIFLAGLGLGSLLLRRVVNRGSPERDLALCQFAIAVLALGAMACQWFILSRPALRDAISIFSEEVRMRPWWMRIAVQAGISLIIMLPATLFMGLSFPLASRLFVGDVRMLGSRVGSAYFLANLGSILGAVLGVVLLLPLLGTIGGTKATAMLNLVLGVLVLLWIGKRAAGAVLPATAAVLLAAVMIFGLPASHTLRGEDLEEGVPGALVYMEEGDLATVQVIENPDDPSRKAMAIDGYTIGWTDGFKGTQEHRKQILLAHLPMVLNTRIRHTLNIGLGFGGTLRTLAMYPDVETLDCVEINAPVVRACELFGESEVLQDPRVTLIVDDAVHFLLRTDKTYDLIISDGKQHPFYSGNAAMLCLEFYRYALSRMTDEGLFVQWAPLSMLHEDFKINQRTLCEVFPYVEVFYFPQWAVLTVASKRPLSDLPQMSTLRYHRSPVYRDLAPHAMESRESLLSHRVAGKAQLQEVLGSGPLSTWDHMWLDFSAFKASRRDWRYSKRDNLNLLLAAREMEPSDGLGAFILPWEFHQSSALVRQAFAAYYDGEMVEAQVLAERAVAANRQDRAAQVARSFMLSQAFGPDP